MVLGFLVACIVPFSGAIGLNLQPATVQLQTATSEQAQAITLEASTSQLQPAIDIQ